MKERYANTRFQSHRPPEPFPTKFAVITAYNPLGEEASDEKNMAATQRLKQHLERLGRPWFPVTGASPDFSHVEPGYGVIMASQDEARRLADEFEQEAFFWIRNGEVVLVSTFGDEERSIGLWEDLVEYFPRSDEHAG